tara:strand:+ start:930 stop:1220 length:291 start_codon:yes stop_codon:yes gene_type:complete
MTVVEFYSFHRLFNFWMILQHNNITWHEREVELVCYLHRLLGSELVWLRYDHQHIFFVKVEIPYVCEYCPELTNAVQLEEFDLAIHYGLLCERAWW